MSETKNIKKVYRCGGGCEDGKWVDWIAIMFDDETVYIANDHAKSVREQVKEYMQKKTKMIKPAPEFLVFFDKSEFKTDSLELATALRYHPQNKSKMILPSKEFLEVFKKTNGALSVAESIAIMNIANDTPIGVCIELGTYNGKSAISAVYGFPSDYMFILVDPIFKDVSIFDEVVGRINSIDTNTTNVVYSQNSSVNEIPEWDDYAYVFVDSGSHGDGLPMQEVKLLEDKVVQGGIICFHDFRSQFIEVEHAYNYLLSTGKYEVVHIDWPGIVRYVDEHNLEEGNVSWHHQEMRNPCFVGAVKRK